MRFYKEAVPSDIETQRRFNVSLQGALLWFDGHPVQHDEITSFRDCRLVLHAFRDWNCNWNRRPFFAFGFARGIGCDKRGVG